MSGHWRFGRGAKKAASGGELPEAAVAAVRTRDAGSGGALAILTQLGFDTAADKRPLTPLERQQDIEGLLTVTRLLHIGDLPAPAISDTRLRDLR